MTNLFYLFLFLLICSSCKKFIDDEPIIDTPVEYNDFLINLEAISDFDTIIEVKQMGELQINYNLVDERVVTRHEAYFLINNDENLKVFTFEPTSFNSTAISIVYGIDDFTSFIVENEDTYTSSIGDEFHFYLFAEDDTNNISTRNFVVRIVE